MGYYGISADKRGKLITHTNIPEIPQQVGKGDRLQEGRDPPVEGVPTMAGVEQGEF